MLFLAKISLKIPFYVSRGYYIIEICTFQTKIGYKKFVTLIGSNKLISPKNSDPGLTCMYNKDILEYAQFARRSGPKSKIFNFEGCSNKQQCRTLLYRLDQRNQINLHAHTNPSLLLSRKSLKELYLVAANFSMVF